MLALVWYLGLLGPDAWSKFSLTMDRSWSSGPKNTAGGSRVDSQKDFWSSWLEDAWKAASWTLAVKDVIEYLVIFVLMWKIRHIYVTVCLDSHLFS